MVPERWQGDEAEAAALERSTAAWKRLQERIAHRFGRVEVRMRVRRLLAGLLGHVERKNGWQLAEANGEVGPQGVQRLLNGEAWDAEGVRDERQPAQLPGQALAQPRRRPAPPGTHLA